MDHSKQLKMQKILKLVNHKKPSHPRTDIQTMDSNSKIHLTTSNSSSSRDITSVKSAINIDSGEFRRREISANARTNEVMREQAGEEIKGSSVCKLPLRKTNT